MPSAAAAPPAAVSPSRMPPRPCTGRSGRVLQLPLHLPAEPSEKMFHIRFERVFQQETAALRASQMRQLGRSSASSWAAPLFQSERRNINCCFSATAGARVYNPSALDAAAAAAAALGAADLRGHGRAPRHVDQQQPRHGHLWQVHKRDSCGLQWQQIALNDQELRTHFPGSGSYSCQTLLARSRYTWRVWWVVLGHSQYVACFASNRQAPPPCGIHNFQSSDTGILRSKPCAQ